ncbi:MULTISPECIES: HAMP domain-containing sensor histidine kinase [unclassified Sphingomonas]|nr:MULTISPECIES: HAMP domain-containing sensor histidine kinase [unclassified Sphingomonas]
MAPPRSLRAIGFAFIAAIALATVLTCLAVYLALVGAIDRQVDKRLTGQAAELLADDPDQPLLMHRIALETRRRDSGDIGFLLSDARGRRLAGNIAPAHGFPPGPSTIDRSAGIHGLTRGRALMHELPGGLTLVLAAESEPIDNHDSHRMLILSLGFGTILLLVVLGTLVLSLAIRRNIEAVRGAAEAIVDGDLRARVPIERAGSAFGRQAEAFNHMLDRIEALMTSLSQISNDVAHDLRTPLARLHGQLARLSAEPGADALRPRIEEAMAQSEEILAMFAAILRITEVEGGDRRAMFRRLDLTEIAAGAAEAIEVLADEKGQTLRLGPWAPAPIDGDERLLTQLVVNLVENAVNHTPPGSILAVSVTREADAAVLTVADDGPGIAPAEHALALRRFGRLEHSRNRPGHGLGLPLVQAIAALHRGALELADNRPGLIARIRLPLAE